MYYMYVTGVIAAALRSCYAMSGSDSGPSNKRDVVTQENYYIELYMNQDKWNCTNGKNLTENVKDAIKACIPPPTPPPTSPPTCTCTSPPTSPSTTPSTTSPPSKKRNIPDDRLIANLLQKLRRHQRNRRNA